MLEIELIRRLSTLICWRIEHFDLLEEDRALSLKERATREEALGKLWDLERTAEISWRQKI